MQTPAELLQLLKGGKIIVRDTDSDDHEGIDRSWYFEAGRNSIMCRESDTIAASFDRIFPVSDEEMLSILKGITPDAVVRQD